MEPAAAEFAALERRLKYHFKDKDLLRRALTHSSAKSATALSYERLEFLGDAVLSVAVATMLYHHEPELDEGVLTKVRAQSVALPALAQLGKDLEIHSCLIVGKMFQRRETITESILADAVEALIAAVYLDGGFRSAMPLVRRLMKTTLKEKITERGTRDYKSLLGQWAQKNQGCTPVYRVEKTIGPHHARTFEVSVWLHEKRLGTASGPRKKSAEQEAARIALDLVTNS